MSTPVLISNTGNSFSSNNNSYNNYNSNVAQTNNHNNNNINNSNNTNNSGSSNNNNSPATAIHLNQSPSYYSNSVNHSVTRILILKDFSPDLKTRDIQSLFEEWEDDRGGFKIKWVDDVTCLLVFADAVVAKKAYLTLLASSPAALSPTSIYTPKLQPYSGSDSSQIFLSVQTRPRSRSITSITSGGHSRKNSLLGSGNNSLNSTSRDGLVRYGSLGRSHNIGQHSIDIGNNRSTSKGAGSAEDSSFIDALDIKISAPFSQTNSVGNIKYLSGRVENQTASEVVAMSPVGLGGELQIKRTSSLGRRNSLQQVNHGKSDSLASFTINE